MVITKTENPAESAVIKAPGRAVIAPNLPNVWDVPAPEITAPSITKIEQIIAALRQLTIRVPTAVPKTLAASLAPSAHPKNRPLDKNNKIIGSITITSIV